MLCHLRLIGVSGMNHKAEDLLGAWGCSVCHDLVDRSSPLAYEKRRAALLEGVARTIHQLCELDVVTW